MRNFTKYILTTLSLALLHHSHAQQIYDFVTINPGYTNQSFYSLANSEVANVPNTDWDLAFQVSGFQASIRINGKNNVRLWKSGLDINAWSNITANDTVGVLNSANELFDQDTSWWVGAFNLNNDTANQFDLGWGVYDFVTHAVTGDSLFFIKLSNGVVKKIWIQSLQNSIYTFVYADIDGSNEVTATLNKTNYAGKNFGYYSIINNAELDREPNKYTWDLTFEQYMAVTPFVYKVTGVLLNDSVQGVKAYPVDVNTVSPWGYGFSYHINTIGYDWKYYDFGNNAWVIEDSIVYFVYDRSGSLWKMQFTGFTGSAAGDFEFTKELISATGVEETEIPAKVLGIYPNPVNGVARVVYFVNEGEQATEAGLFDLNGKQLVSLALPPHAGLQEIIIPTDSLNEGIYLVRIADAVERLVVVK
jgi:hypothetical protein